MKYGSISNRTISRKLIALFFIFALFMNAHAQVSSIVGEWKTVDDKTNETHSIVRIYKGTDGLYYGKIVKMFKYPDAVCTACEGKDKGRPLVGMIIIRGMRDVNGELKEGYVLDPESGKKYYGTISYDSKTSKLKLRGSLDKRGVFGRSQYWIK
ncbi:DUF2147 domain-containing protein [Bacteroidales bacterium OttesenSCG-928-B11]|nr:DUF2147 domain-containing protein [Bacteroidales bacterium OttesenSCG-928-E04]MDL2312332.1 DUF2147 domain-containing protein [Bacteroidales bacterium OttesenSCG-928-B11]MDL2326279.1 DUF2147 domain-containing protein [Bacteroidales bacterium OttesenSCG-928-A14]